ncbi:hypothetical protein JIQ42_06123 [Leishmania sp. Namibia]|uniref:hypothetical protein n=1 Tax=Leishmania sp. Namibia TaxID=2802991 RepID=UPI001B49519B|nr:hypothetical protein JIQ42_06123 [Leishmania sp. Namibia]
MRFGSKSRQRTIINGSGGVYAQLNSLECRHQEMKRCGLLLPKEESVEARRVTSVELEAYYARFLWMNRRSDLTLMPWKRGRAVPLHSYLGLRRSNLQGSTSSCTVRLGNPEQTISSRSVCVCVEGAARSLQGCLRDKMFDASRICSAKKTHSRADLASMRANTAPLRAHYDQLCGNDEEVCGECRRSPQMRGGPAKISNAQKSGRR